MARPGKPDIPSADDIPSKSQLKREAREILLLGRRLAALPPSVLDELHLEPNLHEAVVDARSIRSNVAKKRQLAYLAKLLRKAETEEIFEALEARDNAGRVDTARLHRTEAWRDALIERGDDLLAFLLRERRDAEPQSLRQFIRNARREAKLGKPPASARKLFKTLRDMDEVAALPDLPDSTG